MRCVFTTQSQVSFHHHLSPLYPLLPPLPPFPSGNHHTVCFLCLWGFWGFFSLNPFTFFFSLLLGYSPLPERVALYSYVSCNLHKHLGCCLYELPHEWCPQTRTVHTQPTQHSSLCWPLLPASEHICVWSTEKHYVLVCGFKGTSMVNQYWSWTTIAIILYLWGENVSWHPIENVWFLKIFHPS